MTGYCQVLAIASPGLIVHQTMRKLFDGISESFATILPRSFISIRR